MRKIKPDVPRPVGAPPVYSQDGKGMEAVVHSHYFIGGSDWLVTEYDPRDQIGFGWACLNGDRQNAELGYVSFPELDSIKVPLRVQVHGVGEPVTHGNEEVPTMVIGYQQVERDEGWPEGLTLREGIALLDERQGRS